jgi:hypothetical protein
MSAYLVGRAPSTLIWMAHQLPGAHRWEGVAGADRSASVSWPGTQVTRGKDKEPP